MELKVLTVQDREIITELFLDVFTHEPWNDDWSDPEQLRAYIADLTGQDPMIYDHLAAAMRKGGENSTNEMSRLWPAAKSRQEMRESYERFMRE